MKLRWLRSGSESLRRHRDYIAAENPAAARHVARRITQAARRLKDFPAAGPPGRVEGTRELVVPGLPYLILYRIQDNAVEILRVFHTASNWPEAFRDHDEEPAT